jgi:hypothetical protein
MQRFNTELLQDQMRLRAKVVAATWQRPVTTQASTSVASVCLSVVLLKFTTNKNRQVAFRGCKGLRGQN